MTLDELRRLNFREIGTWPIAAKAGLLTLIVIAILTLGYFLDWRDQYDQLERERGEEQQLRTQYASKKRQAVNLDIYLAQLREVERERFIE